MQGGKLYLFQNIGMDGVNNMFALLCQAQLILFKTETQTNEGQKFTKKSWFIEGICTVDTVSKLMPKYKSKKIMLL